MTFQLFAPGYELPASGGGDFIKLPEDGNYVKLQLLSGVVPGYEYWTQDNKSVRSKERPTSTPGIRVDEKTKKPDAIKHFWVIIAYDVVAKKVGILQISQKTIQTDIMEIHKAGDFNLTNGTACLRISRKGSGKQNTKYTTQAVPLAADARAGAEELEQAANIDLEAVMFGNTESEDASVNPTAEEEAAAIAAEIM